MLQHMRHWFNPKFCLRDGDLNGSQIHSDDHCTGSRVRTKGTPRQGLFSGRIEGLAHFARRCAENRARHDSQLEEADCLHAPVHEPLNFSRRRFFHLRAFGRVQRNRTPTVPMEKSFSTLSRRFFVLGHPRVPKMEEMEGDPLSALGIGIPSQKPEGGLTTPWLIISWTFRGHRKRVRRAFTLRSL